MLKLGFLFFLCESKIYKQTQNDSATWVNLLITVKVKNYELIVSSLQMQSVLPILPQ